MSEMHFCKHRLALFTSAAIALGTGLASTGANAASWNVGDARVNWDNTLSYGMSWRIEDRSDSLVGIANGGTANSVNSDDGNLSYDKWDVVSAVAKWDSNLEVDYRRFGLVVRAISFYDPANDVPCPNTSDCTGGDQHLERKNGTREEIGADFDILDAFVRFDVPVGSRELTVRAGRTVINWGESSVIPNGINVSPFDAPKLRIPGAEIRDVVRPVGSVHALLDLTENLTMEAYGRFEWRETIPDPRGSYFGTSDGEPRAGEYFMTGFGLTAEEDEAARIDRDKSLEEDPDAFGQGGIAFNYYADWLNDTELGFYYQHYNSHYPYNSGTSSPGGPIAAGSYFIEYPEDINLFGVSFNTNILGWAVSGEYSLRQDYPIAVDDIELLQQGLGLSTNPNFPTLTAGSYVQGWRRYDVSQAQITLLKTFGKGNPFFADDWLILSEVGYNHIHGAPSPDELPLEGPGTFLPQNPNNAIAPGFQEGGYPDGDSWGYRIITRLSYLSSFRTLNLYPRIVWFHDVDGTSPQPGGAFVDGRKSLGAGVNLEFLQNYALDLSYNRYFGGGDFNLIHDRDFVSFNFKASF